MASESVKVVVRCRPMNQRERELNCQPVVTVDSARGQCFIQNPGAANEPPKQFTFDGAYYMDHFTEQIYNEIAYPLVEGVTEGYNGTIFAYGQTGSGKSFTMQGLPDPSSQRGIIPRAFEHVFESVQCAENTKFLVRASYLEIYNEDVRDLLGADTKQKLELKEHPEKGVYVKGLSMHTVHNVAQCEHIMETGWKSRSVGYTLMNKDSSRSHSIFTISIEIYAVDNNYDETLSTLRYANRAKNIKNKPRINEDPKDALLREYQEEIKKLKAILAQQMSPSNLSALLSSQAPLNPVQIEEQLVPPPVIQSDTEAEKQLIREEYEERLARLRADYEAEQESRARLEEDIAAMRSSYDVKLSTLEENLRKETEAVLKAEVLKAQGTSRAEFANRSECSPTFPSEMAVKPGIHSMLHTLPGGDVSKTELSPGFEELPAAETSKSEVSLGSDESSTLEETSMSEAYPGPQEPSDVEFSVPEAEAPSSYLPEPHLSPEATEALPQAGPVQLAALGLLPSLHDPFAEVEAKLARLSSAVAGAEALEAGAPRLCTQHPSLKDLLGPGVLRAEAETADCLLPRAKVQEATGNERKALNLPTCAERENCLLASGRDPWEVDQGPEVAEELVLAAEPGVGAEAEAQVALEAQPQPLLATTSVRRDSVGVEVAVLTEDLLPVVDQQQVLARLQLLEQQVVGGEQAKNKDLKEKHKRRKRYADERKKQLVAALQNSDEDGGDWVLLNVYDSIQEEVRAKSKLLEKMQRKLRAAEVEIKDLQSEFQLEKIDYLATIRRQERDSMLFQQLLEQVQPLIRRDCNYSNLEKIRRESCWDEDNGFWKIPEPIIIKTSLPVAVPTGPQNKVVRKTSAADNGEPGTQEEDRYKLMLSRSDSENIASNYFRSKRASQILSTDPMKSLTHHSSPPGLSSPLSNTSAISPTQAPEMPQPRPFRLESLDVPFTKAKRKKSKSSFGSEPL
ncbi:kinesin-like protein KIF17 isoform X8 [Leptonychotes weddellii]|uniref:Kinesin-like protein KIF17 isoform X8 n=1 Tax=Leptonychotes weddellii TaxID=9713 RepID=A0A7F8R9C1_LEPWE|nr:kinesin-like protein KIF17 isoform X8 [Leptonychotes weddellii]